MEKLTNIKLLRVEFIPKELEPAILYVSEEYGAAVHLCACGCGRKVSTPLRPPRWVLSETPAGPTLCPSVGNWVFPCQSHYWIRGGTIVWAGKWTAEEIAVGRRAEEARQVSYLEARRRKRAGILRRIWQWIKSFFGR
jgi:Family of unknown function (DUF6527)